MNDHNTVYAIFQYPPIFKRGSKREIRVWRMDLQHDQHRVISGIHEGAMTLSEWTVCKGKNLGRSNETTPAEQAELEVLAKYAKKLREGYFYNIDEIDKTPFIKPMLATDWNKRKAKVDLSFGVWSQPKLDGIRCIARADGLWTRTGKPITAVPHIFEALAPKFEADPDLILDGELYNHHLKDEFNEIVSMVRKTNPTPEALEKARSLIEYHVYDVPSHPGTFEERFKYLDELHHDVFFQMVPTAYVNSQRHLDQMNERYIESGYEGQIIRLDGFYENKRSNMLMKRKEFDSAEFPVIAMSSGEGNWSGCIKRFTIDLGNGLTCEATPRGSREDLNILFVNDQVPDWATIRYFGRTPEGRLRFPIVTDYGYGQRED